PDLLERIELFDGDGFQPITHRPLDAAILAGMGEATIIRIASMHPQLTEKVKRLVVCTPQMPAVLRPAFARLGYGIADERLAYDGRRFYEVVAFERGCAPCTDPLELLFGPTLLAHPCCAEYVDHRRDDWKSLLDYHGPHLSPLEEWPEPSADAAGEFQRIKVRALDEARRRVRQR
ncbi:MAG: tRNA (adenine(22)-N(1))-methyltransferase TrmK, partial [Myxococcota bacterium]